jgi:hypothetical protein
MIRKRQSPDVENRNLEWTSDIEQRHRDGNQARVIDGLGHRPVQADRTKLVREPAPPLLPRDGGP